MTDSFDVDFEANTYSILFAEDVDVKENLDVALSFTSTLVNISPNVDALEICKLISRRR